MSKDLSERRIRTKAVRRMENCHDCRSGEHVLHLLLGMSDNVDEVIIFGGDDPPLMWLGNKDELVAAITDRVVLKLLVGGLVKMLAGIAIHTDDEIAQAEARGFARGSGFLCDKLPNSRRHAI